MDMTEWRNLRATRSRTPFGIVSLAVVAVLGVVHPVMAAPIFFTITFTQLSAPPSADGPPTGHFSIDEAQLDTGLTHYVPLTTIGDFAVIDDGAHFPASLWTGFLRVPAAGRSLRIQGLAADDPGSNAIAEFVLGSNDPRCLGTVVSTPTTCEAALGGDLSGNKTWVIVSFDAQQNLAVATGTYTIDTVPEPVTVGSLALGLVMLVARARSRRTVTVCSDQRGGPGDAANWFGGNRHHASASEGGVDQVSELFRRELGAFDIRDESPLPIDHGGV
jgi:hypothetical protein